MRKLVFRLYRWVVKLATYLHLPSDKVLHFLCSLAITIVIGLFLNPLLTTFVAFCVGIGKELYDCIKPNPSGWDWNDLLADTIGVIVGVTPFVVF